MHSAALVPLILQGSCASMQRRGVRQLERWGQVQMAGWDLELAAEGHLKVEIFKRCSGPYKQQSACMPCFPLTLPPPSMLQVTPSSSAHNLGHANAGAQGLHLPRKST